MNHIMLLCFGTSCCYYAWVC